MTKLLGKVVAVTGAGSGLGRALGQVLVARGAHVALSDVNAESLRETAALIARDNPQGMHVSTHVVDVRDKAAMDRYASEVEAQHGGADVIINNAGIAVLRHFDQLSLEDLAFVFNVNLWGVIHGIRAFLPLLRARAEGHIVNIGSVNAFVPFPMNSAYNMSKYAVLGLSESLVQELADSTIHVTCVHPGAVKTNLVRNSQGFSQEQVAYFDSVAKTTSESAARAIVRAIEKNRDQLLIGKDAWFMSLGKRLAPVWFVRFIGRMMRPKPKVQRAPSSLTPPT
ncbi:MAG: acetoin dehydrogenase [Myxococcaceae bacterium]|nr:acetoin dehydrogenase [Myxococcaceae bacterium]